MRRLRIGPGCGRLVVRTRRQGLAAKVGHDLTIDVGSWAGVVELRDGDPGASSVTVTVDLASFAVRAGTGGALPLTASDHQEIDSTMHRLLTAGGSTGTFASTRVLPGPDGGGEIDGTLSLNGHERPISLQVTRDTTDHYRATAVVVQSGFGIKPYSAFFGALKLRDEVQVEVEVDLDAAEGSNG